MRFRLFPLLLAAALLVCCSSASPSSSPAGGAASSSGGSSASGEEEVKTPPITPQTLMADMTLEQKVGQLFVVSPNSLTSDPSSPATGVTADMKAMLSRYPVGGVVQFRENLTSPAQLRSFHRDLQAASSIPLFLAVDEEGGTVSRLGGHPAFGLPRYDSAATVGATGDTAVALKMGQTIGGYLRDYGFNMDFAPVADVNTNPDNPVIGSRAFSSDPQVAAGMVSAVAQGLRSQGIIPVFKHFPGHGDTAQDSHTDIAVSDRILARLMECEWVPFRQATSSDAIMVGHIALPSLTGDLTPASLSPLITTDILRHMLGFQGLVITDAMEMGAISQICEPGQAALRAFQAGADLILMPADLPAAFDSIVAAVQDGTISSARREESVSRILQAKLDHGLLEGTGAQSATGG